MTKIKKCLPILLLLVHSYSTLYPKDSFFDSLEKFFFGPASQQQSPRNDSFNKVTLEDYIAQFEADLNGINSQSKKNVTHKCRKALKGSDLSHPELINQKMRSALIDSVGKESDLVIEELRRNGYQISFALQSSIKKSMMNNAAARIERAPHISGENLNQFFGRELALTIKQSLDNQTYYDPRPQQHTYNPTPHHMPTPSSPPAHTPSRETGWAAYHQQREENNRIALTRADEHCQRLTTELQASSLNDTDLQHLHQHIYDTCHATSSINPADYLSHAKGALQELLKTKLIIHRTLLGAKIINQQELNNAFEATLQIMLSEINGLQKIDSKKIDLLFAPDNFEETILGNMNNIACPVCFEFFKEDHRHGQVNKKMLPCGHTACATCTPHLNRKCPLCRASF